MSASELARALLPPEEWPCGSKEDLIFGKIFEEEFALWRHLYERQLGGVKARKFIAKVAQRLKAEGIYSREMVLKAYRIAAAFIKAGVSGETPKTGLFELDSEHGIFYKPDLEDYDNVYELKTHPLTKFDEFQASIFALCVGKPVKLVGVEFDEKGMAHAQMKVVKPFEDFGRLKEIIDSQGETYEPPEEDEDEYEEEDEDEGMP